MVVEFTPACISLLVNTTVVILTGNDFLNQNTNSHNLTEMPTAQTSIP